MYMNMRTRGPGTRHYYSIAINYRKSDLEQKMLLSLGRKKWADGLTLVNFDKHETQNEDSGE